MTRQKYETEQLPTPSFMKHGEKSRPNVCLDSCITSEFSRCISHSTEIITIENQLHFFKYFYNKIIYMKNFCLGFVKVLSIH